MLFRAIHSMDFWPGAIYLRKSGTTVKVYAKNNNDLRGRTAYLPLSVGSEPIQTLYAMNHSGIVWPRTGQTLFISKESKVPRAIVRNSSYKITIDPNNADYVVIPSVREDDVVEREARIAYIVTKADKSVSVHYFDVQLDWSRPLIDDDALKEIKDEIMARIPVDDEDKTEFYYFDRLQNFKIYFIKNCPEIEKILAEDENAYKIVFDYKLRLESPVDLTVDTLKIWDKMIGSKEMLAKTIIGSNWQKYPCTMCVYIRSHQLEWYGGEQMKYILRCIDFYKFKENESFPYNMEVQPEDWNLLQEWIMSRVGLSKDGGFKPMKDRNYPLDFTRVATCYKPVYISEPTLFQEIQARLKK